MDMNQLMQMAGQMQDRMGRAQEDARRMEASGEAGGKLVQVRVNGQHEVLEVHIDPRALADGDVAMLEDLVRAAINQAMARVGEAVGARMAEAGQGMGVDPSMFARMGMGPGSGGRR
jgi:DNA-binding YbaB/EbfC family protein